MKLAHNHPIPATARGQEVRQAVTMRHLPPWSPRPMAAPGPSALTASARLGSLATLAPCCPGEAYRNSRPDSMPTATPRRSIQASTLWEATPHKGSPMHRCEVGINGRVQCMCGRNAFKEVWCIYINPHMSHQTDRRQSQVPCLCTTMPNYSGQMLPILCLHVKAGRAWGVPASVAINSGSADKPQQRTSLSLVSSYKGMVPLCRSQRESSGVLAATWTPGKYVGNSKTCVRKVNLHRTFEHALPHMSC